jgi:hypothetical protein
LSYQCKVLAFPSKWKGFIDDLAKEPEWKNYPPSGSPLKKLLLALLPELVVANSQLTSRAGLHWLYSEATVDTCMLQRIVSVWLETTFSERLPKATIQPRLEQMHTGDLHWKEASFNLAEATCNIWGTASPKHDEGFALLPDLLGAVLTQTGTTLPFGSHRLNFYRSPITGGSGIGSGIELFSWQ